jgi:hypothetical protein
MTCRGSLHLHIMLVSTAHFVRRNTFLQACLVGAVLKQEPAGGRHASADTQLGVKLLRLPDGSGGAGASTSAGPSAEADGTVESSQRLWLLSASGAPHKFVQQQPKPNTPLVSVLRSCCCSACQPTCCTLAAKQPVLAFIAIWVQQMHECCNTNSCDM